MPTLSEPRMLRVTEAANLMGLSVSFLNKTNGRAIAKALGDETRGWAGKDIVLVPTEVDFRGDMVDAIRVRTPQPEKQQAPNSDEPPFDDELGDFVA
jgi:hypothetical protein